MPQVSDDAGGVRETNGGGGVSGPRPEADRGAGQASAHTSLLPRVPRLGARLQEGPLPPPSPVFDLLPSCSSGSDKLNLDCGKGELRASVRLRVLLFLVLFHVPTRSRSCVGFYKGQRNSVC